MVKGKRFEEFFGLLNSYKARYLVVGGYAFAVHGRPRYTGDIASTVGKLCFSLAKPIS